MTERYQALTRAQLDARLRSERDALAQNRCPPAERQQRNRVLRALELELQHRDAQTAAAQPQREAAGREPAVGDDAGGCDPEGRRHLNVIARAARANALGEMASGIAHELSQPLSAIVAYARAGQHLLQVDTPEARQELEQSLEKVAQQAERASDIVRRIRSIVHKQTPKPAAHRLDVLVRHALAALEDELQENAIEVDTSAVPSDLNVQVDGIFIEQVLVNLLRNAIDSIVASENGGGKVDIVVSRPYMDWAEVCVGDNGEGLAGRDPEQWFMPFSTSRRGSLGLSLSLSRSLVEAHGGRLWAEATPNGGAVLRFTLPVAFK